MASEHLQFFWHPLSVQADCLTEVSHISLADDRNVTTKICFHLALLQVYTALKLIPAVREILWHTIHMSCPGAQSSEK